MSSPLQCNQAEIESGDLNELARIAFNGSPNCAPLVGDSTFETFYLIDKIKANIYLVSKRGICTCRVEPPHVQNERLSHNVTGYR
jgi:hypothetical protein